MRTCNNCLVSYDRRDGPCPRCGGKEIEKLSEPSKVSQLKWAYDPGPRSPTDTSYLFNFNIGTAFTHLWNAHKMEDSVMELKKAIIHINLEISRLKDEKSD